MKDIIPGITFIQKLSFFQMCILYVNSYNLKCPSKANWKFRSYGKCNSTLKYFCLFNNVKRKYVEGCSGPDWDRKGSKRIYARDFTREQCIHNRFQPFKFQTNESMSDCVYSKSICSENGQIVHTDDSTKIDRTCRCDYTKKYSFNKVPKNVCFCIPTEEDCSCYIKSCPENMTLSPDYECTKSGFQEITKCTVIKKQNKTLDEQIPIIYEKNELQFSNQVSKLKWRESVGATTLFCFCLLVIMIGPGGCFLAVLFPNWILHKLQFMKRYFWRKESDPEEDGHAKRIHEGSDCTSDSGDIEENMNGHQRIKPVEPTIDERNFLRIIHLLFRVAHPAVRIIFNQEIQPNQLRKTLDKNKAVIAKQKKKNRTFNDKQWDLLFKNARDTRCSHHERFKDDVLHKPLVIHPGVLLCKRKEKPLSSGDFDIRLMINLLSTLVPDIKVGNKYPVQTDISVGAMLTRIKFITNEATRIAEGKISGNMFNQYWDDIGQAILLLVSTNVYQIQDDEHRRNLMGRLMILNPIHLDHDKLSEFIVLSETYPAMILQQILSEYCKKNRQCVEDILTCEKHELYHKRIKTESCCACIYGFSTYSKILSEKQWESMYELKLINGSDSHCRRCTSKQCIENFFPKKIDTFDLSVTAAMVLYIPDILQYIMKRLFIKGFDKFLMNNVHTLFHSMEKRKCCLCSTVPTDKILFYQREWNKLFQKNDTITCRSKLNFCCCQFSVRKGIDYSNLDDNFLSKIVHVAGPIGVLNKVKQDPFLYFLNWNDGYKPLYKALFDLSKIIKDDTFGQRIPMINSPHLNKTVTESVDTCGWIARHLENKKVTTKQVLHIIVPDKGSFIVKCVQVPKDVPLPTRTKYFTDVTTEENNFLLAVYCLTNIVYPAIKRQFERHFLDQNMAKMVMNTSWKKGEHFHLPQHDELKSDIQSMIYYLQLKSKYESLGFDIKHLDDINAIRREIVESCTGILDEPMFRDILKRIITTVKSLSENICMEYLSSLHHIKNILDGKSCPQNSSQFNISTDFLVPKYDGMINNQSCIDELTKKRKIIKTSKKKLTQNVDAAFSRLNEVKTCIDKIHTNLEMCRQDNECLDQFKRLRSDLKTLYKQQISYTKHLIVFSGIPELNERESPKQTENIIKEFMETEMKMNPIMDTNHAIRFGKQTKNTDDDGNQYITRPIMCRFRNSKECNLVISKARATKSTQFGVTELFSNEAND